MAKTLKRIYAGSIVLSSLCDRVRPKDSPKQRAAKRQASSEAQRKMNQINSYQQLELMLAVNFPTAGSGLVTVVTFDDAHMPKNRREALDRLKYFKKLLREARRAAGLPDPVICSAPEVLTSESGRWHFHLVIDNTGQDYDMIRSSWIYGSDVDISPLRVDKEKNHETLARYMTKELRECQDYDCRPGLHSWSWTRNAKRPETDAVVVQDDFQLDVPEDATVLLDEQKQTAFAAWRVMKIRYACAQAPKPRARRRRR